MTHWNPDISKTKFRNSQRENHVFIQIQTNKSQTHFKKTTSTMEKRTTSQTSPSEEWGINRVFHEWKRVSMMGLMLYIKLIPGDTDRITDIYTRWLEIQNCLIVGWVVCLCARASRLFNLQETETRKKEEDPSAVVPPAWILCLTCSCFGFMRPRAAVHES